ncbi:hypothetical protein [Saccharopolyspora phatthalungensis]|uniref:Uncharacterized protein n=1 Tax=Saccharopolyspora phatthalungensis TaxID=664693 RepID=A0A840PWX7_9PSEU|nr:hypothetical protein [Saccharopolyspora phatthalungensis]MBB5154792.1 hypothetical protein [Saccharopolyspora phatthalungensis]
MFWIQLSTFVLFNLLIAALLVSQAPMRSLLLSSAQHAGTGQGTYSVWHLIADIEAENKAKKDVQAQRDTHSGHRAQPERPGIPEFPTTDPDEPTGRHHLRT